MLDFFYRQFKLKENQTSLSQELTAGLTTFLTMSYIIFVNPEILGASGMNTGAVYVATCLVTILSCLLSGFLSNYPIVIAPAMGLNVFFTYTVVQSLGLPWQSALGIVFLAGVIFFILALTQIRQWIIELMPETINVGTAAGIGLFITLIGLQNSGIIVKPTGNALIGIGNVSALSSLLCFLGFFIIITLDYFKIRGAIIISILLVSLISFLLGKSHLQGVFSLPPSIKPSLLALDIKNILRWDNLPILFAFILVGFFDATGTMVGVLRQSLFRNDPKRTQRISRALIADSLGTISGSLLGTASTSTYIESAAGIEAGGRTGLTAVVAAVLFIFALFISPLAQSVPAFAVAPALIYVGLLMLRNISHLQVDNPMEFIPAIIIVIMIPFTFSIANGLGMGIITYAILKIFTGKIKQVNSMIWGLTLLFLIYFAYHIH
jgi:AGZA family xanthine/uracil permease-like MFS transporter